MLYSEAGDVLGATLVAHCLQRVGLSDTALLDGGCAAYAPRHPLTRRRPPAQGRSQFLWADEDVRAHGLS